MKKALVTVHLGRHFRIFGQYDYKVLKDLGYEVHIASNFSDELDHFEDSDVIKHQISFDRNPFSLSNIKAYFELKKILTNNKFEIIQTQSPSAGVITRLAARKTRKKNKTKVFYTPHGYHFFKGSSKIRWSVFYPIEKILSYFTDVVITINEEDYDLAKRKKMGNSVEIIPGVGVDSEKFTPVYDEEILNKKEKLGFNSQKILVTYIGELSTRKNQKFLIESIAEYKNINQIQLCLVGTGNDEKALKKLVADKDMEDSVLFLGYRTDVADILKATDIVVSASYQEGLPVNIIESMFSGKPILASNCRGNRDLVKNNINGFIYEIDSQKEFLLGLEKLVISGDLRCELGRKSREIANEFSIINVANIMRRIYSETN